MICLGTLRTDVLWAHAFCQPSNIQSTGRRHYLNNSYHVKSRLIINRMQGQAVASCDSYGIVKIWDIRLIAPIANINVGPHPANKIAFDSSGTGGVVGVLYYPSLCLSCT